MSRCLKAKSIVWITCLKQTILVAINEKRIDLNKPRLPPINYSIYIAPHPPNQIGHPQFRFSNDRVQTMFVVGFPDWLRWLLRTVINWCEYCLLRECLIFAFISSLFRDLANSCKKTLDILVPAWLFRTWNFHGVKPTIWRRLLWLVTRLSIENVDGSRFAQRSVFLNSKTD